MKKVLLVVFSIFSLSVFSQTTPPTNLTGTTLRTWLKTNWYDSYYNQLGYDNAREQMYGFVDKQTDGQVYCVYTGFHQTASFTTYLNPINAEHTIPQSFFGQDEPMRGDLFHLYPTHETVNGARSNNQFSEINDSPSTDWYIVNTNNSGLTVLNSIPTSNIQNYSESISTKFEPREDHKGDVARSVFYFFTVYPTQAGSITSVCDIATLLEWHENDPASAWEIQRNTRIQSKQGNKNPYIIYPELACRAWGSNCESSVYDISNNKTFAIYPNPSSDFINVDLLEGQTMITIFNTIGQKVFETKTNDKTTQVNISNFEKGLYIMQIFENQKLMQVSKFSKN